jgi:hypothetical protein
VSGDATVVIPLEIAAQGNVSVTFDYEELANDYLLKIYADDSYINLLQSSVLNAQDDSLTVNVTAGARETLYLMLASTAKEAVDSAYSFTISATLKEAKTQTVSSNKTLQNKTWTKKRIAKVKSKNYYKLTVKKNSYLYLGSNNAFINVQLFDSRKKETLSNLIALKSSNNFQASFALAKGTYYVCVTADYQTTYQLYYQSSRVKNVSGKDFKTAAKMELGEQYLGVLTATSNESDGQFYKFKINKAKKLQIAFYVENSSDKFNLQIYDADKQLLPTNNYQIGNSSLLYINSWAQIPAGTYYMRVTKTTKTSSGCYSLMVRTK